MPDDSPHPRSGRTLPLEPKVLRMTPRERERMAILMERVLAAHPAWPWPLIEEEARRRADRAGDAADRTVS